MKIVTVNIPKNYLDVIAKLTGEDGLYPSRSELVRVAVRKFLIKELKALKDSEEKAPEKADYDKSKYVRIPITSPDNGGNGNNGGNGKHLYSGSQEPQRYKTYKILRKLN
jgi:Arc/MetJ-type ribon-helix-helix transcriptional regulator